MRSILGAVAGVMLGTSMASAATPVENVLDPVLHSYQEYGSTSCTLQGDCTIVFPVITVPEVLILHASCTFSLASSAPPLGANLHSQNANPSNSLATFANGTAGGSTYYGINAETYLFVSKNDIPVISVFALGAPVQNLQCTLSGYHR